MTDVDKMIEVMAEMREVIRLAHEATKDLRTVIKEAKELKGTKLSKEVDDKINAELVVAAENVGEIFKTVTDEATKKVYERFDLLSGILLGTDTGSVKSGKASLYDLAKAYVELNGPVNGLIPDIERKDDGREASGS